MQKKKKAKCLQGFYLERRLSNYLMKKMKNLRMVYHLVMVVRVSQVLMGKRVKQVVLKRMRI